LASGVSRRRRRQRITPISAESSKPPAGSTRILGIDPGTRNVGFGVIDCAGSALRYVAGGCINTTGDEIAGRLVQIHSAIQEAIRRYGPSVAVIETVFAGENRRTAIAIGEGRGVAILSAAEFGLPVVGLEPALVKRAVTGSGRAGKEQVQEMVRVLLGLRERPATDHEADALALAITYAHRFRAGRPQGLPLQKRRKKGGPFRHF
jgi:crossover junction endodeoxyribonuclease RuvC